MNPLIVLGSIVVQKHTIAKNDLTKKSYETNDLTDFFKNSQLMALLAKLIKIEELSRSFR